MAISTTINARLPEDLKRSGSQVLEREGITVTQAIRALFEQLQKEQKAPEWMLEESAQNKVALQRDMLRSLVGAVQLPENFDAKKSYLEHLATKHNGAKSS